MIDKVKRIDLLDEIDRKSKFHDPVTVVGDVRKFESFLNGPLLSGLGINLFIAGSIGYNYLDGNANWSQLLLGLLIVNLLWSIRIGRELTPFRATAYVIASTTFVFALESPLIVIPILAVSAASIVWLAMKSKIDVLALSAFMLYMPFVLIFGVDSTYSQPLGTVFFLGILVLFLWKKRPSVARVAMLGALIYSFLLTRSPDHMSYWSVVSISAFVFCGVLIEWLPRSAREDAPLGFLYFGITVMLSALAIIANWPGPGDGVWWSWAGIIFTYQVLKVFAEESVPDRSESRLVWAAAVIFFCLWLHSPFLDDTSRIMACLILCGTTAWVAILLDSSFLHSASLFGTFIAAAAVLKIGFTALSVDSVVMAMLVATFFVLFSKTRPSIPPPFRSTDNVDQDQLLWLSRLLAEFNRIVSQIPILGAFVGWTFKLLRWLRYIKGDENSITMADLAFVFAHVFSAIIIIRQLLMWQLPNLDGTLDILIITPVCVFWGVILLRSKEDFYGLLPRFLGTSFFLFPVVYLFVWQKQLELSLITLVAIIVGFGAWVSSQEASRRV